MATKQLEESVLDDPNEVSAASVSVPGVLIDKSGHQWTIPEDDESQDMLYRSPFDIPKEEGFYYQFEVEGDVAGMITQGFRPVTRKELGMDGFSPSNEYGVGPDSIYKVNNMVCLKIPKVLNDRRLRGLQKISDMAVQATEPKKRNEELEDAITINTQSKEGTKEAARAYGRLRGDKMTEGGGLRSAIKVNARNPQKETVNAQ